MVMVDQVCWNEMNNHDELTFQCADKECRPYERQMRMALFQKDISTVCYEPQRLFDWAKIAMEVVGE